MENPVQNLIDIYKPVGNYEILSNNYVRKFTEDKLIIENNMYSSVYNFIYSNLVIDKSNKIMLQNYPPLDPKNLNIYNEYTRLYNLEYTKLLENALEKAIRAKLEYFPEFKHELLKLDENMEIQYISESSYLGVGSKGNGYNLYGKVLRSILIELKTNKFDTEQISKQERKNMIIYNLYKIYEYLTKQIISGIDIIKFVNNNNIDNIISSQDINKLTSKFEQIEVIIHKFNKSELNPILIKEINRILNEMDMSGQSLNISEEFVKAIRNLNIDKGRSNRLIYKKDVILNSYITYMVQKKFMNYIPDNSDTSYFNQVKNRLFDRLTKEKQQNLINRLMELYDLEMFDETLQNMIKFKLNKYTELIDIPDAEIIIQSQPSNKEESVVSSSSSSSSSSGSIMSESSQPLSMASSKASTVSPGETFEDETILDKITKGIELKSKIIKGGVKLKSEKIIYITKDSILSASHIQTNKFIKIDDLNYPSIAHFIIKCRLEYLLNLGLNISEFTQGLSDRFSLPSANISEYAYTLLLNSTDFHKYGIINENVGNDMTILSTNTFIDLESLQYVYNRIQFVLIVKYNIDLCRKGLDVKFKSPRALRALLSTGNSIIINNDPDNYILGTGDAKYVNPYKNLNNVKINDYMKYSINEEDVRDFTGKYMMEIRKRNRSEKIKRELQSDKLIVGIQNNPKLLKWIENKTKDILSILEVFYIYLNQKYNKTNKLTNDEQYYIILNVFENCKDFYLNENIIDPPDFYKKMFLPFLRKYNSINNDTMYICWKFIYNILNEVVKNKLPLEKTILNSQIYIQDIKKCKPIVDENNCLLSAILYLLKVSKIIQEYIYNTFTITTYDIDLAVKIILSQLEINIEAEEFHTFDELNDIKNPIYEILNIYLDDTILLHILNSIDYVNNYVMDSDLKRNRINYFAFGDE